MSDDVIMVGGGGHAKVCIELLRAMGYHVAFCIGADPEADNCLGVPLLPGDEHLARLRDEGYSNAFIAIGHNRVRERLAHQAQALGYTLVNAISPTATVSPTASLGEGVAVMAGAVINADTRIGNFAIINTAASVDHDGRIGNAAHIAPHSALAGTVTVGDRAFLGIGCRVVPGMTIGADATVGAGAVVIGPVEAGTTVVGVPASRVLKQ